MQAILLTAGNKNLPAAQTVQNILLPLGIQLTEHIVQQQDRVFPNDLLMDLPGSKLQGQGRRAGLPL